MVTIEYMVNAALGCDTVISRAFLRACGIAVPRPAPPVGAIARADSYGCIAECFANRESPMDGRR